MKIIINFIMLCLSFLVITYGCERTELHQSSTSDSIKIEPREITECEECPTGDCCCAVELQNYNETADLYLCGTSDGTENCDGEAVHDCDEFSGGGQGLYLNNTTPRRGFCIDPGQAFWIGNLGGTYANIYVTCQYDQISPQTLTISIPPYSRVYIGSGGECVIVLCE